MLLPTRDLSVVANLVQFYCHMVGQKNRGHFVLRLVTSEILIRFASNLASIRVILFLTLIRNLFESTLENKVAPSSE